MTGQGNRYFKGSYFSFYGNTSVHRKKVRFGTRSTESHKSNMEMAGVLLKINHGLFRVIGLKCAKKLRCDTGILIFSLLHLNIVT